MKHKETRYCDHCHERSLSYKQVRYCSSVCQKQANKRPMMTCKLCETILKAWADYPELRYDIDNGRTLCQVCHYKVTFGKEMKPGIAWGVNKKLQRIN